VAGRSRFDSRQWREISFSAASRPAEVHPTSYPMGTGGSFPGDKAAGGGGVKAHHSPPATAEIKNGGALPADHSSRAV
jgi:hypothetical protein